MGIRMSQFIGLSDRAKDYLAKNCLHDTITILRNGIKEKEYEEPRSTVYQRPNYDEEFSKPALREYTTLDEHKLREIIQASPWDCGPMYFLCLQNEQDTRLFEWTEEEMEKY